MPPPSTSRIRFRPWSPELRADFAVLACDPRVVRHIPPGTPWPEERIDEFVARQMRHERDRGHSMWWIGRADAADMPIGFCGLQPVPDGSHVEIGWWLRPEQQGRGLASEAARAVLAWAWQATALPAVLAHTVAANTESLRVMERIGMQRLGVFPAASQGRPGLDLELTVYRAERPR
ncbi:MAG: GNAT family N-acetyltransferase [Planctomycetota bacterium]